MPNLSRRRSRRTWTPKSPLLRPRSKSARPRLPQRPPIKWLRLLKLESIAKSVGHPGPHDKWPEANRKLLPVCSLIHKSVSISLRQTNAHLRGHEWNTIRDTTPPIYLTRTGIRSRSSIKSSDGTSHRQGTYSTTTVVACSSGSCKCLGDLITGRAVTRAHGFAVE